MELSVAQGGVTADGRFEIRSRSCKLHRSRYHKKQPQESQGEDNRILVFLCSLCSSAVPESHKCWWWLEFRG